MPFHYWISQLDTGMSYIDALHHDCVTTLTHLSQVEAADFIDGFGSLVQKVERAFRTEERWMEELHFPELPHHREQHAYLLGTLYRARTRVQNGDLVCGRQLIDRHLPEWLLLHGATMDCALADQLRAGALAS